MANDSQSVGPPDFKPEDEIDELFGRANPNSTRADCPPRDVLLSLARKKGRIDDPVYEHLAKCSPCYREFRGYQQSFGPGPRRFPFGTSGWLRLTAGLVIIAGGAVWFALRSPENRVPTYQTPPQESQPAEQQLQVDLRKYTVTRSEEQRRETGPVSLTRGRLDLTMLLPVGFEPGRYEVQIVDSSLRSQASAKGEADVRDFVTTLHTALDLRSLATGTYQLALRYEGNDWRLFPAELR
jgi:hypothetical protein